MPLISRTRWFDASLAVITLDDGRRMIDAVPGIDVSKETLDTDCMKGQGKQSRKFVNDPNGWQQMLAWLKAMGNK